MKYVFLTAAASLAAIGVAHAQTTTAPMMHGPRAMQAHTRAQVADHVRAMFARLDTNRDGYVTQPEMQAVRAQHQATRQAKVGERRAKAFERIDANRDGAISRGEWDAMTAQHAQRMAANGGEHGLGGMRHMRMAGMGFGGRMFSMADADRDGRVSIAEAQAAALAHFDRADLNRDGSLTPEERRQARQQMRAMHRS